MPTVVANVLCVSGVQHHAAAKSVLPLPVTSFEVYITPKIQRASAATAGIFHTLSLMWMDQMRLQIGKSFLIVAK